MTSQRHLDALFFRLGALMDRWISEQRIFPVRVTLDYTEEVKLFYDDYLSSPFRDRSGVSRFNNLLWLSVMVKVAQPRLIVDSGTYTGASAWAFSRGAPDARILSFDLRMDNLRQRQQNVEYIEDDWTSFRITSDESSQGVCYFDDHVDQVKRLLEAADRGFPWAIFDDDFPVTSFAGSGMAHQGRSLPKIEFVLDEEVRESDEVAWIERGREFKWKVDGEYLNTALSKIAEADRVADTSIITGIQQTPYRVLKLNNG